MCNLQGSRQRWTCAIATLAVVAVSGMCLVLFVFVLATCVPSYICLTDVPPKYTGSLRLVNAVFRHGERTPVDTYPKDPHIKFDFHPYGWGQLTKTGKLAQFQQGQYLRQRYNDFLGTTFTTDVLRLQSTDVDRTKMSALLTAAGLFPPTGYNIWNPELDWQPVPLYYEQLNQDKLLLVRIPCPRYHEELDSVKASPEVTNYTNSLTQLYKYLSENSGRDVKNPDDVQDIYSTMTAEVQFHLSLPAWTGPVFPGIMGEVTAYSFVLNTFNDELKKIKGGPLLKKMLLDSVAKANNSLIPSSRKIFLYAGHDSTVANIMQALKVWDQQVPVNNILAIVELHEVEGVFGWKIFLRNSTHHEPYLLTIPGCTELCPLEDVLKLTQNVIPQDLEEECKSKDPNYVAPPPSGP